MSPLSSIKPSVALGGAALITLFALSGCIADRPHHGGSHRTERIERPSHSNDDRRMQQQDERHGRPGLHDGQMPHHPEHRGEMMHNR